MIEGRSDEGHPPVPSTTAQAEALIRGLEKGPEQIGTVIRFDGMFGTIVPNDEYNRIQPGNLPPDPELCFAFCVSDIFGFRPGENDARVVEARGRHVAELVDDDGKKRTLQEHTVVSFIEDAAPDDVLHEVFGKRRAKDLFIVY